MENGERGDGFYTVISQADAAYEALDDRFDTLLEDYFVDVRTELIEVEE
ncbi:hypothetical protein ACFOLA_08555 [Salinicoccus hispanicus]|uniref:Uncharacterized protein n=1 Tax=Salinicoccus hispanicus TaxID=157225 RepID=A0A6N8U3B9_9STAP|nr:hypothetical protein [Salinicoccus hispanicus]MXQ51807.1 hypothetical protein [Salinicoccus hispanicus]